MFSKQSIHNVFEKGSHTKGTILIELPYKITRY